MSDLSVSISKSESRNYSSEIETLTNVKVDNFDVAQTVRLSLMHDFIAYDSSATKWIVSALSSTQSIKRLSRNWKSLTKKLQTYYEIPDKDSSLLTNGTNKGSAFNSLYSLYLNPLGIAIYTDNQPAIKLLLSKSINSINDPLFLQKWWNKGNDVYLTDFTALPLITLVIRRSYFHLIPILMNYGFKPNEHIYHLEHIQSANECKTKLFRDSLDLALNLIHELPAINIGQFFKAISDKSSSGKFNHDVFEIDKYKSNDEIWEIGRVRSLFRLILLQAHLKANETFLSKYLTILLRIQQCGFFRAIYKTFLVDFDWFIDEKHGNICESRIKSTNEIKTERLSLNNIRTWSKPNINKLNNLMALDIRLVILLLMKWVVRTETRRGALNQVCQLLENVLRDVYRFKWLIRDVEETEINSLFDFECCGLEQLAVGDLTVIRSYFPLTKRTVNTVAMVGSNESGDVNQSCSLQAKSSSIVDGNAFILQNLVNARMCPPPLTIRTKNISQPTEQIFSSTSSVPIQIKHTTHLSHLINLTKTS